MLEARVTSYSRRWNKKRLARVCRSHGQQRMPHLARAQLLLRGIDSTLHCPAQSKYVAVAHALMLPWCLIPQLAEHDSAFLSGSLGRGRAGSLLRRVGETTKVHISVATLVIQGGSRPLHRPPASPSVK